MEPPKDSDEVCMSPEIESIRARARRQKVNSSLERVFYTSEAAYEWDLRRIWCRDWIWAGHVSQLPNPADYLVFSFGTESIIIVRDGKGALHAHLNVCRHRGSRVCLEASGNTRLFSCPYHGWTYNLDGTLRSAREMDRDLDPGAHGLRRVQLLVFQGLIFVCLAEQPPALEAALGRLAPHVAPFEFANLTVAQSKVYPVPANWKLAVENYLECYHCARAHPEYSRSHSLKDPHSMTEALMGEMRARSRTAGVSTEVLNEAGALAPAPGCDVYHRRYPLYPGYDTGSKDGAGVAPLLGTLSGYDGGATDVQIGALNFFLAYSDHVVGYRFLPRGPQHTDIHTVWMVRADAAEGEDYQLDRLTWLWNVTTLDDERIIRHNQEGVNSLFYRPGPLSGMEWAISDFVRWYTSRIA